MKKLLRDLLSVVLGFGIMFLFVSAASTSVGSSDYFACWLCSGVVIGWKVTNNIFHACGLMSLVVKFLLSIFVGIFATPIVLVLDLVGVVKERTGSATVTG